MFSFKTAKKKPEERTVTVLRLRGDLDAAQVRSLVRTLNDLVLEGKGKIILNFQEVDHVNLSGIGELAQKIERLQALGAQIVFTDVSPYVANLFKLVGAYAAFCICEKEEEALARFDGDDWK